MELFRICSVRLYAAGKAAGKEEKKMKKLIALILSVLMLISAAAMAEPVTGGWTPSADPAVTEALKELFEKGTETLTGASYIPVAYLGSQVVAGTNHAFLCQAVTAYPGSLEQAKIYAEMGFFLGIGGVLTYKTSKKLKKVVAGMPLSNAVYEVFSATGTVGLSRGVTPHLSVFGRILIILCMYLGRIGPISLALFFHTDLSGGQNIRYAQGRYYVG